MGNYVKPNIIQKFSGVKIDLWNWLEGEIGNQDGPFELNQSKLAKKFDVSRKSIQNALKTFQSANLLEKVKSRTGRGVHSIYRLTWTFKSKSATPTRVEGSTPRKKLTKGRQWRYFAYKFRTKVENSSLKEKTNVIVGKILNTLKGKPPDLFQKWLTRLKRWLAGAPKEKTLQDFFVFFHDGLMEILRSVKRINQTKRLIERQRKQREKARKEYQQNPPPRSKDYGSFNDYLKAMEEWSKDDPPGGQREAATSSPTY